MDNLQHRISNAPTAEDQTERPGSRNSQNEASTSSKEQTADQNLRELVVPRTLKGFKDLLPSDAQIKGHMLQQLEAVFRSFGFLRIETPHLEYAETLLGRAGAEINKQVYRFRDHGDRDISLRFDLTVPFARYVVQHKNELGLPFRRYAIGNVFRGENPQAGRYREFTQCDFDLVGNANFNSSRAADAEVVQVMISALDKLAVPSFSVRINNRKIFNGLCETLGAPHLSSEILRAVDKIGKVGKENVARELQELGLQESACESILDLILLSEGRSTAETCVRLARFEQMNSTLAEGIRELRSIVDILGGIPSMEGRYQIDLSIARGLGYYTGVVFETFVHGYERLGSVCSGGRYADLTSSFSTELMPGVGASVGLDRLIAVLEELKLDKRSTAAADALIILERDDHVISCHSLAAELRAAGLTVETYPLVEKAGVQFKYAERRGHPYVLRLDPAGSWTVITMANGERASFLGASELLNRLSEKTSSPG